MLKEAAREIRAKGLDNVAVAGVMARAGLTHGGFYAHFASKDELVAEAIGTMFEDARSRVDAVAGGDDPRTMLLGYVEFYLSKAHRDGRERGCPLPTLSSDCARSAPAARDRFGEGVRGMTARLRGLLQEMGRPNPPGEATAILTQMVGAVALSRAVGDPAQSDAILADARADLITRYALDTAR